MRKNLVVVCLAVCCAVLLASSVALAAENWLGKWKLNVAKSEYNPGPPPKSLTVRFVKAAGGIKFISDGVDAEGKPTHGEYLSRFDGRAVPWKGNPLAEVSAARKIDDSTYENVWKKNGLTTIIAKAVVSEDGKTMTVTMTGTDLQGRNVENTAVFDRR